MMSPFQQFAEWFEAAKQHSSIIDATSMSLATVADGQPSVRIVLLKGFDENGFVFYTNLGSRKARELLANPKAALCFHWAPLEKQVRIEGTAERVSDREADAYFASRPRESQLGAWASKQSELLSDYAELLAEVKEIDERFAGKEVTRPPHWSGFRIRPSRIEFWQQGEFRLHHRDVYVRDADNWRVEKLYP